MGKLLKILLNRSLTILQEAGDEEKKEVSNALKKLRYKYDAIHKMVVEKTNQLDLIKKGVEKIGQEEHKVE